jgi:hypothetical protein
MSKLMRLVNAQLEARAEKTKQGKVKWTDELRLSLSEQPDSARDVDHAT